MFLHVLVLRLVNSIYSTVIVIPGSNTYAEAKVWRRPAPKLEKQGEDLTEFPEPVFLVVRQYIYLSLVINSLDGFTVHAVLLMLEENSLQSCRTLCMNACTS